MLVWLASYPRSGNTLLRQVLKCCFDLRSCEGLGPMPAEFRKPDGVRDAFYGSYFVDGDAEEFYHRSRTGPELVLVKTHLAPRDAERAIYVVRDGRLAVQSFVRFNDTYHPGRSSFESLVVGDESCGGWTGHYRAWCERERGDTLVLRFEELVGAGAPVLGRIATFLGLPGPIRPWSNRHARLCELDPAFFGPGAPTWRPDAFWTEARLRTFYTLHGPLLARLGYAPAAEVEAGAYPADSAEGRMLRAVAAVAAERDEYRRVCAERDAALRHTSRAHAAQAEAVAELAAACERRDRLLAELAAACAARDRLHAELAEACAARDRAHAELAEACAARDRAHAEHARRCAHAAESADRQLHAAAQRLRELGAHCARLERRLWWRRLPLFAALRRLLRPAPPRPAP
jgi:hypothetical protein